MPRSKSRSPVIRQAVANLSMSPQCRLVLDFLKTGRGLTNLIALTHLGVGSVTKRIADLRDMGFNILGETKTDFRKHTYMIYSLAPPETKE